MVQVNLKRQIKLLQNAEDKAQEFLIEYSALIVELQDTHLVKHEQPFHSKLSLPAPPLPSHALSGSSKIFYFIQPKIKYFQSTKSTKQMYVKYFTNFGKTFFIFFQALTPMLHRTSLLSPSHALSLLTLKSNQSNYLKITHE